MLRLDLRESRFVRHEKNRATLVGVLEDSELVGSLALQAAASVDLYAELADLGVLEERRDDGCAMPGALRSPLAPRTGQDKPKQVKRAKGT